jgi:NAD(P)-dependent dehydrogenase (short-subunit alcohol dehydrogenase family)
MDLQNTVTVVTGASRGIGRAVSAALVEAGAHVHGLARSADALAALADALGPRFTPHVCDVTNADAVQAAIDAAAAHAGRLDVLVANAGLGRFGAVDALPLDDWHAQVDTNLSGVFYATRAAVPHMKRQQDARPGETAGHIVHVASVAGLVGNPSLSAYNATKFALRGFADATMKELRPFGIRTTCLYPGSVATDFQDGAGVPENPQAMQPEDLAETVLHVLRMPHRTLVSEVVLRPSVTR